MDNGLVVVVVVEGRGVVVLSCLSVSGISFSEKSQPILLMKHKRRKSAGDSFIFCKRISVVGSAVVGADVELANIVVDIIAVVDTVVVFVGIAVVVSVVVVLIVVVVGLMVVVVVFAVKEFVVKYEVESLLFVVGESRVVGVTGVTTNDVASCKY